MLDIERIEQDFNYCLDVIISKIENKTATEIVSIEQPMILLFKKLIHEIESFQSEENIIIDNLNYDFMVGFTLFNPYGFKTRFRHFDKLKTAELFASNKSFKDNCKIYVDYLYYKKLERKLKKILIYLDWIDDDMLKCCSRVDVNGIDIIKILKEE